MSENASISKQQESNPTSAPNAIGLANPDFEPVLIQRLPIQLKLSVGDVNDPLENEADAIADRVMRMPETSFIQRRAAANDTGDYDDEHVRLKPLANQITPFIQAKGNSGGVVSDSVSSRIKSSMGGGSTMDTSTRSFMENRFGANFGDVKIHNNPESEQLNRSLDAKAFTVSNNIYFNSGQYQPESGPGKHLLAHELTHVVQQNNDKISSAGEGALVQRFESEEHQQLGDMATGNASYNIGTTDKFELTHGDILALSGDVFMPEDLFRLAAIPGKQGQAVGTRDEVLWALQDPRIWEMRSTKGNTFSGFNDPRFTGTGLYANYVFHKDVKKAVFDRYRNLGAANASHFVAPEGRTANGDIVPSAESAGSKYVKYHEIAIREADRAGRAGESSDMGNAYEAAAQHFLTDAFSAGHLRTPIALIRKYWGDMYPLFWFNLRHKIALDTAIEMTSGTPITAHMGYEKILAKVEALAPSLPALTLGDLIGSVFHDIDNANGLKIKGGGKVMGDSHLDAATSKLAIAAIKAGNKDINEAYKIGKQMSTPVSDTELFGQVHLRGGGTIDKYAAELLTPVPDAAEPPQNWKAPDFNALWQQYFLGNSGETVGDVISRLVKGGSIAINLTALSTEFPPSESGLHPQAAYLKGFVAKLQADPKNGILDIINWAPHDMSTGRAPRETGDELVAKGAAGDKKENLGSLTFESRVKYINGLISDGADFDINMIITIFSNTPVGERAALYKTIEGHDWAGDFKKSDRMRDAISAKVTADKLKDAINGK